MVARGFTAACSDFETITQLTGRPHDPHLTVICVTETALRTSKRLFDYHTLFEGLCAPKRLTPRCLDFVTATTKFSQHR